MFTAFPDRPVTRSLVAGLALALLSLPALASGPKPALASEPKPALASVPKPAPASVPKPVPRQFQFTRTLWRVSDGLPEDTVQALAESSEGRLWIGTAGGLARFDGSRIEVQGPGLEQPVLASSIFCLTFVRDGTLWAGTEGSGLLRLTRSGIRFYSSREGLSDGFVRSVYQDGRSRLWVGTDDGLFVLEGDRLRRVDRQPTLVRIAVHSITEDRDHRIWVGGSRLIAIDPDGASKEFALPGAYSENRVKRILQTADGTMWVGTVGGLQFLRDGRFQRLPGIHATVRTLLQTSDGTLWIGTIGDGLWTLRNGHLSHVLDPGLLPSDTVLSVFEDDQHQIWIGTQAGLVRLSPTPVNVVTLPQAGDPDYETISGDDRGNVWVAAQSLYLLRDGIARRICYGGRCDLAVRNVYRARDGALWIGTDGSGVYRVKGAKVQHFTAPAQLTNNFIRAFMEGRDGAMWIATDEGLSRIGADGARKFTEADGLTFFSTRSLLESRDGRLWIGTDHGLSLWKDGRFAQDLATRTLQQEKIWSILQDRTGALWFGTRDHGLFRYRAGALRQFTTADGLPSNSIYQVLQDRKGTFWLSSPNTLFSIPEADMEQSQPSPEAPLRVEVYSMPFGADGAQMYGGRQPSGYIAPDDTIWFPTARGIAEVADVPRPAQPAPRAALDDVVEDGRSVVPGDKLVVHAHVVRLSFAFAAISLAPQQGVRVRYELTGFDRSWNAVSNAPAASRLASYTNLRAGRYRFRVQAFNTANPTLISEYDLAIVKSPFFYETWWFYPLCGVMLAALVWSLYRLRVGQMQTRFAAVLEERGRLAREMHDTVIQGCTGISALLEAMATTGDENQAARKELLEYARVQARASINEARQAIWNMRHGHEKDVDLIPALQGIATQTTREFGASVAFGHNVERMPVGSSAAHEILMTVREAVYNSVQHSGSHRVDLKLRVEGDDLTIAIADQGRGFSPGADSTAQDGHYGIVGMRERMQRLGGHLDLSSTPGAGTTVQMRVRRIQRPRKG